MRIFLLPISSRRAFIYCDRSFNLRKVPQLLTLSSSSSSSSSIFIPPTNGITTSNSATISNTTTTTTEEEPAPSIVDRATEKAAQTWSTWERADGGWQKKLTTYGNALLRRIPYQEWALKSFPPLNERINLQIKERTNNNSNNNFPSPIEVLFPANVVRQADVLTILGKLARERQDLHWKRMIGSAIGAPLTLPFALVPIIPNIPGFYFLYRAYSHYRAYYGSKHLELLLSAEHLLRPTPSDLLDEIYKSNAMDNEKGIPVGSESPETLYLKLEDAASIADSFELKEMSVEIERAIEQVDKSIKSNEQNTTN